jgi:hypothetical protein
MSEFLAAFGDHYGWAWALIGLVIGALCAGGIVFVGGIDFD